MFINTTRQGVFVSKQHVQNFLSQLTTQRRQLSTLYQQSQQKQPLYNYTRQYQRNYSTNNNNINTQLITNNTPHRYFTTQSPQFSSKNPLIRPFGQQHRNVHAFTPNTKTPQVKPSSQQQLDDFLGRSDHRPLTRVDQAAKTALQQSEHSSQLVKAGSSGKFYLISRLVFAFETWTILFFSGAFAYYIYNVLKYREDSPWDIAVRIWENFVENSRQYRQLALGKQDPSVYREDVLRDKLVQNPNDEEAATELRQIEARKAKRVRYEQIKAKEEAKAMAEFTQLSQDLQIEQQKIDLQNMQEAFQKKMASIQSSGGAVTEADLLAFIQQHNDEKAIIEQGIKSTAGKTSLIDEEIHQRETSKRKQFQ